MRRRITTVIILLVLALLTAALVGWWALGQRPAYYEPVVVDDPAVRAQAERVEQVVSSEATRVRPAADPMWQVTLTQDQINHWLAVRMPQWLANQQIDTSFLAAVRNPMVGLVDGRIELAAETRAPGMGDVVVRLVYEPQFDEAAQVVRLRLAGIRTGSLPLPTDAVLDKLVTDARVRQQIESLALNIPLGDGRTVTIAGMQFQGDAVTLVGRTTHKRK